MKNQQGGVIFLENKNTPPIVSLEYIENLIKLLNKDDIGNHLDDIKINIKNYFKQKVNSLATSLISNNIIKNDKFWNLIELIYTDINSILKDTPILPKLSLDKVSYLILKGGNLMKIILDNSFSDINKFIKKLQIPLGDMYNPYPYSKKSIKSIFEKIPYYPEKPVFFLANNNKLYKKTGENFTKKNFQRVKGNFLLADIYQKNKIYFKKSDIDFTLNIDYNNDIFLKDSNKGLLYLAIERFKKKVSDLYNTYKVNEIFNDMFNDLDNLPKKIIKNTLKKFNLEVSLVKNKILNYFTSIQSQSLLNDETLAEISKLIDSFMLKKIEPRLGAPNIMIKLVSANILENKIKRNKNDLEDHYEPYIENTSQLLLSDVMEEDQIADEDYIPFDDGSSFSKKKSSQDLHLENVDEQLERERLDQKGDQEGNIETYDMSMDRGDDEGDDGGEDRGDDVGEDRGDDGGEDGEEDGGEDGGEDEDEDGREDIAIDLRMIKSSIKSSPFFWQYNQKLTFPCTDNFLLEGSISTDTQQKLKSEVSDFSLSRLFYSFKVSNFADTRYPVKVRGETIDLSIPYPDDYFVQHFIQKPDIYLSKYWVVSKDRSIEFNSFSINYLIIELEDIIFGVYSENINISQAKKYEKRMYRLYLLILIKLFHNYTIHSCYMFLERMIKKLNKINPLLFIKNSEKDLIMQPLQTNIQIPKLIRTKTSQLNNLSYIYFDILEKEDSEFKEMFSNSFDSFFKRLFILYSRYNDKDDPYLIDFNERNTEFIIKLLKQFKEFLKYILDTNIELGKDKLVDDFHIFTSKQ